MGLIVPINWVRSTQISSPEGFVFCSPCWRNLQRSRVQRSRDDLEGSSVQCRSPSLSQWISPIRMRYSYAHIRESTESLSALSLGLLLQVLRQLCESLRFIANSVLFCCSGCMSPSANCRLYSVRSRNPLAFAQNNRRTMGERHEHMSTPSP
jgi:hypothetical protein